MRIDPGKDIRCSVNYYLGNAVEDSVWDLIMFSIRYPVWDSVNDSIWRFLWFQKND